MSVDLWPANLDVEPKPSPLSVLKAQGEALAGRTNQLVRGEVLSEPNPFKTGIVSHTFYLTVPALGNYRYRLFRVEHGAEPYPLQLIPEDGSPVTCEFPGNFEAALVTLFASVETRSIVSALVSQASVLSAAA